MADAEYAKMLYQAALALAMAFFAMLVLVVALATGSAPTPSTSPTNPRASVQTEAQLTLRPSAPGRAGDAPALGTLLIHFEGRYYDAALKPVDPATLPSDGELVVAIDPNLSAAQAMLVNNSLARPGRDLVLTTLDPAWLNTLKEMPR